MRANSAGDLWFLVASKVQPERSAFVGFSKEGNLKTIIEIKDAVQSRGLAVTARGVATVVRRERQAFLREYGIAGSLLSERPIGCFSTTELLVIGGRLSTTCPDGTINIFGPEKLPTRRPSWARPGAIVAALSDTRLAIVDQGTAQVLLSDITKNVTRTIDVVAPEVQEALSYTASQAKAVTLPPDAPPPGQPVIAMDVAGDASGVYLLIWPYQKNVGPAVVKYAPDGALIGRFRCHVTKAASWHKIEVRDGFLIIGSTAGDVLRYKL